MKIIKSSEISLVFEFVDHFLIDELEYNVAIWCEEDWQTFEKIESLHRSYFSGGVAPLFGRPDAMMVEKLRCNKKKETLRKRSLYKIKVFQAPHSIEQLFLCYVGPPFDYLDGEYDSILLVKKDDSFSIRARYHLMASSRRSEIVLNTGLLQWYLQSGIEDLSLGKLLHVENYTPPKFEQHLKDYLYE